MQHYMVHPTGGLLGIFTPFGHPYQTLCDEEEVARTVLQSGLCSRCDDMVQVMQGGLLGGRQLNLPCWCVSS